jgi:hypothetical protein
MFLRKVAVLVLCCFCVTAVAYAQRSFPTPQDPAKSGTMMLTRTDSRIKSQAESYLNQGEINRAVAALKGISNQWVSHWFLSFAYETNLRYKEALGEVDWLVHHSQRKDLTIQLTDRKHRLEREVSDMDQDLDPQPQKKALWTF